MNDLAGRKFGRLTPLKCVGRDKKRHAVWLCECQCGNELRVSSCSLVTGNTRSCGCLHIDTITTHGHTGAGDRARPPTYSSWLNMVQRCTNPYIKDWQFYGARGIIVCDRWKSFDNFLEDMGERPSREYSIDRFPNKEGNYEPGNCRWATRHDQNRNKVTNKMVTINGVTACLTDWAEKTGINFSTLSHRIFELGMTPEIAISTPVVHGGNRSHLSRRTKHPPTPKPLQRQRELFPDVESD